MRALVPIRVVSAEERFERFVDDVREAMKRPADCWAPSIPMDAALIAFQHLHPALMVQLVVELFDDRRRHAQRALRECMLRQGMLEEEATP